MRRIAVVLVLVLPACKSRRAATTEVPGWKAAPITAPVAALDLSVPSAPSNLWADDKPERKEPPSEAELKAVLKRTFAPLGGCIARALPPEGRKTFELRFRVEPSGDVSEAALLGLPDANACVKDVFATVKLPAWRGDASIVSLTLQRSGEPLPVFLPVGDGGI